ncbi:unnamed protein product [Adineta steineri]|uniref:TIL domain-containing protein n=1 Tax=Adineta steineri TaxID=433720 RepID=A0A813WYB0_9BILA|nr:unnamed protein product [Adineta steineri]CAF1035486.1 unnamed protein product [Adineta steineri]CAF1176129.1 unnamed protein product [Adineta steineri]CAF1229563.1 unnamed protein product [Adineta steineri]CAF1355373.1 unnamed protein product [Adineta steineri]
MSLSSFKILCILFLTFSIVLVQAQFWGTTSLGQCYGRFEQYRTCSSTCPDTCQDIIWPNQAKICNLMCRSGCECIYPFVRLNQNLMSPCVHPRNCQFRGGNYARINH